MAVRKVVARGRRRMNGVVKDVAAVAQVLGSTEKMIRSQIARGLLPHRRLGGRIVVIEAELTDYLKRLPGTTADEALKNAAVRAGEVGGRGAA